MSFNNKKLLVAAAVSASLASACVHAGGMGPSCPEKMFLVEAGVAYAHPFYKDSVRGANSYTVNDPNGRSYDPSKVYPNDFFGGYFGLSFLFNNYLVNSRYELYEKKSKTFSDGRLYTTLAPAKLAFTLDKLWDANANFKYGIGAGTVISTHNKAELYDRLLTANQTQIGVSFPGRVRLDPLIEGVAMYQISDSFRIRGNVSYQIPAHSFYTNGHLGINLGINYAIPVC